jgi:hypothetical protein
MSMLPVEHKCAECLNESCLPVEFRGVKPLCAECRDRYDADQRERLGIDDSVDDVNDTGTPSEAILDFIFAFNDELVAAFGPGEITFHVSATADGDGSLY